MSENEAQGNKSGLFSKMSQVMGMLERLPKNGYNAHFKYHFIEDSDVLDAVRKAMSKVGLCLFVSLVGLDQGGKKTMAHLELTFADGETGETMVVPWTGEAIDTQDKGVAKATTSGVKYALLKTFLISTGDEPDTDREEPAEEKAKKAPKKKAAASPAGQQEHTFANGDAAMDGLLAEANRILGSRGYEGYNHRNHVKNSLKGGGWTGYNPSKWQAMLDFLVERKAEPDDGGQQWWAAPEAQAWLHETLGFSDKDITEALGVPLADYEGDEAAVKAALMKHLTAKLTEKARVA